MTPVECLRVLGLPPTATRREVKRRYRRLALQLHPDRNRGNEAARTRFVEVSHAYQVLMRTARGRDRRREFGVCRDCGQYLEIFHSVDGTLLCKRCILRPKGLRFLPMPVIVVVKCLPTAVLNASAFACLVYGGWTGDVRWLAAGFVAGFLGLCTLAVTAICVRHCARPDETAMQKRLTTRRPQSRRQ